MRRLRDGFSRLYSATGLNFSWSVRFIGDGRYIASGGGLPATLLRILDVRMGKCVARLSGGHVSIVRDLAVTPDGKGLLSSASMDNMVIHWEVSLLKSTHEDHANGQEDLTGGLREISRFVGHKVRRFLVFPCSSDNYFRPVLSPFLYLPMPIGLRLAHGIAL